MSLHKIEGLQEFKDHYPDRLYKCFKTTQPEWWSSIRHAGDTEFCEKIEFERRSDGDDPSNEKFFSRPVDLEAAVMWVKGNIHKLNQGRLITAMRDMQKDPDLWFHISY